MTIRQRMLGLLKKRSRSRSPKSDRHLTRRCRLETLEGRRLLAADMPVGSDELESSSGEVRSDSEFDFGDAPDTSISAFRYATRLVDDGARHRIVDGAPLLGERIDAEDDGQPSFLADADDVDALMDDEDGLLDLWLTSSPKVGIAVLEVTAELDESPLLDGWIDFNDDGDFDDEGEQIFRSREVANGLNTLGFEVPEGAVEEAYLRLRISSEGGLTPSGLAEDGEVEDYAVALKTLVTPDDGGGGGGGGDDDQQHAATVGNNGGGPAGDDGERDGGEGDGGEGGGGDANENDDAASGREVETVELTRVPQNDHHEDPAMEQMRESHGCVAPEEPRDSAQIQQEIEELQMLLESGEVSDFHRPPLEYGLQQLQLELQSALAQERQEAQKQQAVQDGPRVVKVNDLAQEVFDANGQSRGIYINGNDLLTATGEDRINLAWDIAKATANALGLDDENFQHSQPIAQWLIDSFTAQNSDFTSLTIRIDPASGTIQKIYRDDAGNTRVEVAQFGDATDFRGEDMGTALIVSRPITIHSSGTVRQSSGERWREYRSDGSRLDWHRIASNDGWKLYVNYQTREGHYGEWETRGRDLKQEYENELPTTVLGVIWADVSTFASDVADDIVIIAEYIYEDPLQAVVDTAVATGESFASGESADSLVGAVDGLIDTMVPLPKDYSIPDIGPIYGNDDDYNGGRKVGIVWGVTNMIVIGNYAGAGGPALARYYTVGETFLSMGTSTYNIATGQGTAFDLFSFLPAASYLNARWLNQVDELDEVRHLDDVKPGSVADEASAPANRSAGEGNASGGRRSSTEADAPGTSAATEEIRRRSTYRKGGREIEDGLPEDVTVKIHKACPNAGCSPSALLKAHQITQGTTADEISEMATGFVYALGSKADEGTTLPKIKLASRAGFDSKELEDIDELLFRVHPATNTSGSVGHVDVVVRKETGEPELHSILVIETTGHRSTIYDPFDNKIADVQTERLREAHREAIRATSTNPDHDKATVILLTNPATTGSGS